MSRQKRLESNTQIYHILIRGINRQRIFEQADDYLKFLDFLLDVKKQSGFVLYAYCLMDNHVHLLLKENAEPLAQIFRRLGTRYAQWFNRKYDRVGSLFQNRYCSEPVEKDEYFLAVLIYIYQNPVKAGICKSPMEYKWSSRKRLGKEDCLIDGVALNGISDIYYIRKRERDLIEDCMLNNKTPGRRATFSDATVAFMLRQICGVHSTSDFQHLAKREQKLVVAKIRAEGVPIRQIARMTGLGKGVIEYWGRK
jgi:REP element-mobilizing transposase RayT